MNFYMFLLTKCFSVKELSFESLKIDIYNEELLINLYEFYAPFMGIVFSGLCIGASVRSSVRLSRFRLKFLVEVVFDEVEVQSTRNLVNIVPDFMPHLWALCFLVCASVRLFVCPSIYPASG